MVNKMDTGNFITFLNNSGSVNLANRTGHSGVPIVLFQTEAKTRIEAMKTLSEDLCVAIGGLPNHLTGFSLKELFFINAISLMKKRLCNSSYSQGYSISWSTHKKDLLNFLDSLQKGNAPLLTNHSEIVQKVKQLDNGRMKNLFNDLHSELEKYIKTAPGNLQTNENLFNAWNKPLYHLHAPHVQEPGDWRPVRDRVAGELQSAIYLPTVTSIFLIEYSSFCSEWQSQIENYETGLKNLIQGAGLEIFVFAQQKFQQMSERLQEFREDHVALFKGGVIPAYLDYPYEYLTEEVVKVQNNYKQSLVLSAHITPFLHQLASNIESTSEEFQKINHEIEQTLNELKNLATYLAREETLTTADLENDYQNFLEQPLQKEERNAIAGYQIKKGGFSHYQGTLKSLSEASDLLNDQDLLLQICHLSASPILRSITESQNSHDLQQMQIGLANLQPLQILEADNIKIVEMNADVAPILDEAPTEDPIRQVVKLFKGLRDSVQNPFAKKAAAAAHQLARQIKREMRDRASAETPAETAEHLSHLLIQLSLLTEQTITSMRLEQVSPRSEKELNRVIGHKLTIMIRRMQLSADLKTRFLKLTQDTDRVERYERYLYEMTEWNTPSMDEELLRKCEDMRHQGRRVPPEQVQQLVNEVYQFMGETIDSLATGVSEWLNQPQPHTGSTAQVWESIGNPQELRIGKSQPIVRESIEKIDKILVRIKKISTIDNLKKDSESNTLLANSERYLELAKARLSRASRSNNLSAFYLTLHRYMYHAIHQLAMAIGEKSGEIKLEDIPRKNRSHSLLNWAQTCKLNTKSLTVPERDFLWSSSEINHVIRYAGETLKTNNFQSGLNKRAKQAATAKEAKSFLQQLNKSHAQPVSESSLSTEQQQTQELCQPLCQETCQMIEISTKLADRFLKKINK